MVGGGWQWSVAVAVVVVVGGGVWIRATYIKDSDAGCLVLVEVVHLDILDHPCHYLIPCDLDPRIDVDER